MSVDEFIEFRRSELYQDIKLKCGLPPTTQLVNPNWNLVRGLLKREHGLASPAFNGDFSCGQQRSIMNLYPPNQWTRTIIQSPFFNGFPTDKINVCRFDENGSKLVVAYLHQTATTQNTTNGICLFNAENSRYTFIKNIEPNIVKWAVTDVDISPCGDMIAYATFSKSVYVKPINGFNKWESIGLPNQRETQMVMPLHFTPCGKKLIGSYKSVSFFVADLETHSVEEIPLSRQFDENFMCSLTGISNRNPNLYVCGNSNSGLVDIFDTRSSRQLVKTIWCHSDGITHVDSRNDGNYILTNSKDNSARIWDIRISSNGQRIFKKCENFVMSFEGHTVITYQQAAKFSPLELTGQRYIYCGCSKGNIIIYDMLTGQMKERISGHRIFVNAIEWHPKRNEIISGSWDGAVHLNVYKPPDHKSPNIPLEDIRYDTLGDDRKEKDETFWSKIQNVG